MNKCLLSLKWIVGIDRPMTRGNPFSSSTSLERDNLNGLKMKEIWKDIPGYNGYYQSSTLGRIRNKNKILNQCSCKTKGGKYYLRCAIYDKPKLVHRLVAMTFIPNPDNKQCVDHIDFNEKNNRVENLRWVTPSENSMHSRQRLYFYGKHGEDHPKSKITNQQWDEAKRLKGLGIMYTHIARLYGIKANLLHKRASLEKNMKH